MPDLEEHTLFNFTFLLLSLQYFYMQILSHIWTNYKTTIASLIALFTVYALGRDLIAQDTAELITQIVAVVGGAANILMKKH